MAYYAGYIHRAKLALTSSVFNLDKQVYHPIKTWLENMEMLMHMVNQQSFEATFNFSCIVMDKFREPL